jgi:hypothetical protein
MKRIAKFLMLPFFVAISISTPAQSIPIDSLFLGQTSPGTTPKIFKLEVTPGTFAAERITISNDRKEIFYSEIKSYYPTKGAKVRYYKYQDNKWNGSYVLFDGYMGPALSITGDTVFVEKDSSMYYSVRGKSGWSNPVMFIKDIKFAHYLQVTKNGSYYVSARSAGSVGGSDWSSIKIAGKDTIAASLGFPVNRVVDDLDFYIAKDEKFMITCQSGPICISYPDKNGHWSNGRYLNGKINFGISGWGVYVSPDNKYLFYTTGTKQDYSDVNVHWVSMGNLVDSLKGTNLPPYVKNLPKHQTVKTGEAIKFIIPKDAVCDDDGVSIRYEVLSLNGTELPKWLSFDKETNTLSGIPETAGKIVLRVNAYDDKGTMTAFGLVFNIVDK